MIYLFIDKMKGSDILKVGKREIRVISMVLLCFYFFMTAYVDTDFQSESQKGFATVWGRARYWQNTTTTKPVKQAKVKIIDANTKEVLGEGETDYNGEYWITIYLDGSKGVYAKILCES